MFAINHAATALLNRRYPNVSLVALLVSVQAMEFVWVLLNYLGIEPTTTEPVVRYVGDINPAYMPFSHSVLTVLAAPCASCGHSVTSPVERVLTLSNDGAGRSSQQVEQLSQAFPRLALHHKKRLNADLIAFVKADLLRS
jgi:hypothetical protein